MPKRHPLTAVLDLAFPPTCPACDERAEAGAPLCERCIQSLYELSCACLRCAEPLESPERSLCWRCAWSPPPFSRAHAPYRYGGELAIALRRLKLEARPDIARTLAPLFSLPLAAAAQGADAIIPVPLSWRNMARRTFNQSQVLLAHADTFLPRGCRELPAALRRVRHTPPQAGKATRAREENVRAAFAVPPRQRARVRGRRLLLVDDIMTTGATLSAAAEALFEAGAEDVACFAFARAER